MTMMWPLPAQDKGLDVAAHLAELTGLVETAGPRWPAGARPGQSLWRHLLRLGHDLQAAYFALAGDGDCGETLQLADGRVVKRLPEPHGRPYRSIFGDFTLERVVYGTREGQAHRGGAAGCAAGTARGAVLVSATKLESGLGRGESLCAGRCGTERILGFNQSVASLETMTRTLAGTVADYEATRPPAAPATGAQIVVLSADGKGVPLRKPADAPAIAAHDHARDRSPTARKWPCWRGVSDRAPRADPTGGGRSAVSGSAAPAPVDRTGPRRPVPREKRVCAVLPVAAAVAEALAPPRPVEVIFPWLQAEARRRDPDHHQPWVVLMDGQTSLWDAAARPWARPRAWKSWTCSTRPATCGKRSISFTIPAATWPPVDEKC